MTGGAQSGDVARIGGSGYFGLGRWHGRGCGVPHFLAVDCGRLSLAGIGFEDCEECGQRRVRTGLRQTAGQRQGEFLGPLKTLRRGLGQSSQDNVFQLGRDRGRDLPGRRWLDF